MKLFLKKKFFDDELINSKIQNLKLDNEIEFKLINKYLTKSGLSREINIQISKEKSEKILKRLLQQGFEYNNIIKYLKEKKNLYDLD